MLSRAVPSLAANRISLAVVTVSASHREALAEWRVKLTSLAAQRHACPARERNASLRAQMASAIHSASEAIAAACAEPKGALLAEAIAAVAKYFPRRGDARAAVLSFPAIVDLHFFLMGPEPSAHLGALAQQAEEIAATIGNILESGEVWNFTGAGA